MSTSEALTLGSSVVIVIVFAITVVAAVRLWRTRHDFHF